MTTETTSHSNTTAEPNELIVALQREQQRRESAEHKRRTAHRAIVGAAVKVLAGEPATQPKASALGEALAGLGLSILDLQGLVGRLRAFREADAESDLAAAEKDLGEILRKNSAEWKQYEADMAELQQAMAEAKNRHYSESVVARERMNHARYAAPARRDALRADLELAGVVV